MPERPYLRESLDQLRSRFQASQDVDELERVADELGYRRPRAAAKLLEEVNRKIRLLPASPPGAQRPATALPPATQNEPAPDPHAPLEFDEKQSGIVHAPIGDRVIVNAPPGTGKTAVACGRIAWLLDQDIPENGIWLLSFTRTAIAELRNRIAMLARDGSRVHGVVVGTVDSRAWRILNGFTGEGQKSLLGGYDLTIASAIQLVAEPTHDLRERLDEVRQLIVDEAQDLVGERARFVELLIRQLPADAGVIVLCDEAQAIYGFSEDSERVAVDGTGAALIANLRGSAELRFREETLTCVHRTESANLRALYTSSRAELLRTISAEPQRAPAVIRERVLALQDGPADTLQARPPASHELLLYRRRIEVLDAAMRYAATGQRFRVRTSGLPRCIHPWLGVLFGDFASERLSRSEFDELWPRVQAALPTDAPAQDDAWALLREYASERSGVSTSRLRELLARGTAPDPFMTPEFGLAGPIFSTIHASKGREADDVRLHLPAVGDLTPMQAAEEARVQFVGASRARRSLRTRSAGFFNAAYLKSGRVVRATQGSTDSCKRAQIEVGRDGDVDTFASIEIDRVPAREAAGRNYMFLASLSERMSTCRAVKRGRESGFRYELVASSDEGGDERSFGALGGNFKYELYATGDALWNRRVGLPPYIQHLRILGTRTIAVAPGDPRLEEVHEPFASSGFWLAPLVLGFTMIPLTVWSDDTCL